MLKWKKVAVHFIYYQCINKYLTSIKYSFSYNLWGNFHLFSDISKSVLKSSFNADITLF